MKNIMTKSRRGQKEDHGNTVNNNNNYDSFQDDDAGNTHYYEDDDDENDDYNRHDDKDDDDGVIRAAPSGRQRQIKTCSVFLIDRPANTKRIRSESKPHPKIYTN